MIEPLTPDEVLALPASVDIVTAGRALGFGRTKAHELARSGLWPVPLLRLGSRYRVRRSDLLEVLGIADPPRNGDGPAPPSTGPYPTTRSTPDATGQRSHA
jgi:hypothetical protein